MRKWLRAKKLWAMAALFALTLAATVSSSGPATAAGCPPPPILFGRYKWCGYFYSKFDSNGVPVRLAGVPNNINSVGTFSQMINQDWNSGNAQKITEGAFVYRTMTGAPLPAPPLALGSNKWGMVTAPMIADFNSRLAGYANLGENGFQSFGTNGSIDWFVPMHLPCGVYNSYYQPPMDDIAPYINTPANSTCANPAVPPDIFIIFRDTAGNPIYIIRRACMNPMGTMSALSNTPINNYTLTPSITPSASTIEAGQSITWTYTINYSGAAPATGVTCNVYANVHAGPISPNPPSPVEGPGTNPGVGPCPNTISSTVNYATETKNNVPGNRTICRSLFVSPSNNGSGTASVESCVTVTEKPYMHIFGGDTSAGNGQTVGGTCTPNTHAAIVSWNQEAPGGFAGSGSEFANYAMDAIYDYASNMGNASATNGSNLSFGNTTAAGPGGYGGAFGSLPCVRDYYSTLPAGATPWAGGNISALATGSYKTAGSITITGGIINPGQRTVIYVNGDVAITGDITYSGNWDLAHAPLFELIAKGNIYINDHRAEIDGLYVAQPNGLGGGGTIYTCSNGFSGTPTSSLAATCSTPLIINGAFVANQVVLGRSENSLAEATPNETPANSKASEIFNYSPLMWMITPPGQGTAGGYDAITSLPPVL